jgi:integrase
MARARRGVGEGSIYQRGDGRWVAQIEAGRTPTGRRRYLRAVRAHKNDALAELDQLRRRARTSIPAEATATAADYLDWWATTVLPGTVRDSTVTDYRWVLDHYVKPHVGRRPLARLAPTHVQAMMRALEDAGYSPRTRQYARAVLVRALGWAETTGLVTRNAARLVDGPRGVTPRIDDMTATEARQVLDHAHGDRLEALAVVALRLGLRRGEALALRWEHVDLDAAKLTVTGTLKASKGGGVYVNPPKTSAGRRTIPLVAGTAQALRDHRRRQLAERIHAGPIWRDTGYVFTRPDGQPIHPNTASAWWNQLTAAAGVGRRRFHSSRHTCASLLLAADVPLEVVSSVLGHSGLAVTANVYARVSQDAQRRALSKLDEAGR